MQANKYWYYSTRYSRQCAVIFYLIFNGFIFNIPADAQGVNDAIVHLTSDEVMQNGMMSFSLIDKKSGDVVASYNPNISLVPASSLKILTCAYGLKKLGTNFKFKTMLQYSGMIDASGVLKGDLFIKGYGDPTLGSEMTNGNNSLDATLDEFLAALKSKGIKKITGNIYGDANFLSAEGIYNSWAWYDLGNYYAAGVYGLNINDNLFTINYVQTSSGNKPKIQTIQPSIPGLTYESEVVCSGSKDNAYIFNAPGGYHLKIRGSIPAGQGIFKIKGSLPDPPLMASILLKDRLQKAGIITDGEAYSSASVKLPTAARTNIYTHYSLPLNQIVTQTLLKSINLNTEAIMRYCGATNTEGNSTANSIEFYKKFIANIIQNNDGFFICDGSGLSSSNALPTLGFTKMLRQLFLDDNISEVLINALPVAGESGTLKAYLINSPAKGKIKAKTGSMDRVRSFSGIIFGESGNEYIFSMILNNYNCSSSVIKSKIEQFFTDLYLNI